MLPFSISFVIPMYNERQTIQDTVSLLTSFAKEMTDNYEIIIANDGSDDGSKWVVEKMSGLDRRVKAVSLDRNTKFGGALRAGIKAAAKDVILYTDSDLPADFSDMKKALSNFGKSDIVTAYSIVKKDNSIIRVIISKVYNYLVEVLFNTRIRDINSGFKIYKRALFDGVELTSRSPFIDVEIFVRAIRKGCRVDQYPIVFRKREKGKSYIARPAVIARTMFDMIRFKLNIN